MSKSGKAGRNELWIPTISPITVEWETKVNKKKNKEDRKVYRFNRSEKRRENYCGVCSFLVNSTAVVSAAFGCGSCRAQNGGKNLGKDGEVG